MKAIHFPLIVCAFLGVSGCNTSGDNPLDAIPPLIGRIQDGAKLLCNFIPTAVTVAGILKAGVPELQIADAICKAIAPQSPAPGQRAAAPVAPEVAGVLVEGTYVPAPPRTRGAARLSR